MNPEIKDYLIIGEFKCIAQDNCFKIQVYYVFLSYI